MRSGLSPRALVAVLAVVGLAWLAQLASETLEGRRQAQVEARSAAAAALTETRTQLAGLARRAAADPALTQNLAWNLSHSVAAALSGKLSPGELDRLWIVDEKAQPLGEAHASRGGAQVIVPRASSGAPRPGLFWRLVGEEPAMGVVVPFARGHGPGRWLVAVVELGKTWRPLHPRLVAALQRTGLELAPENDGATLLFRDGIDVEGRALASLAPRGPLERYALKRIDRGPITNPFLGPAFFVTLAGGVLALVASRRRETGDERRLAGVHQRIEELLHSPSVSCLGEATVPPPGPGCASLPVEAEKALLEHVRVERRRVEQKDARIATLEEEIASARTTEQRLFGRLASSAELESLAAQMAQGASGFLAHADGLAESADELTEVLGGPIAEQSKLLFNVMMEWQEGVTERGARKFVRGLAETEGSAAGVSLLDEQIMALATMAGEISDLAVNASLRSHRLVEGATALGRVAGHWHGLAEQYAPALGALTAAGHTRPRPPRTAGELAGPLDDALALLHLDRRTAGVRCESRLDDHPDTPLPMVARAAWATALYHVLTALAALDGGGSGGGAEIVIGLRLRVEAGRAMLIAQLRSSSNGGGTHSGGRDLRRGRVPQHLEIARAVLAPFGVAAHALPALDGPFPIAFGWTLAAVQSVDATVDAERSVGHQRPQSVIGPINV